MRYWAREILHAIKDMVCKSTYMLKGKITLDNICVFDSGLGMYFSDLQFREECEDSRNGFALYEARCLKNYAELLLDLLYLRRGEADTPEKRFEFLKAEVDPVLFYIVWFAYKESKERKKRYFDGTVLSQIFGRVRARYEGEHRGHG